VAQGALGLWAVFAPVALGVNLAQRSLLRRIADAPGSVRLSDLVLSDDRVDTLNHVAWGLFALSAAAWMFWWICAYRAAADRRALRYGKVWAFGGWFVPFAGLVVPKRVADDLWTASREPDWPRDHEARSSWTILSWWGAWLLSGFVVAFSFHDDRSNTNELLTTNALYIARAVLLLVAAVLAIRFVSLVTTGFVAQSAGERPAPVHSSRLAMAVSAVVLLVVTGAIVSTSALAIPTHGGVTSGPSRIRPVGEHFSIALPQGWVRVDEANLPAGVTFAASRVGDVGGITVVEGPAGAAISADELRVGLGDQFDLLGEVVQTSVTLPAGDAECFTFTAFVDDVLADGWVYVFRGTDYDHVLVVLGQDDVAANDAETLDDVVGSFRIEAGQGA
jgi:hypothetical protein